MSDVGGFLLGVAATAAGVAAMVLPIPGGRFLGTALISFGIGQMTESIAGRPSNEDIQANVGSPEATIPVVYGTAKLGLKLNETWVNPNSSDREELIRGGVICVGSEDGSGIEGIERIWLDEVKAVDPVTEGDNSSMRTAGVESFFDGVTSYIAFRGTDSQPVPTPLNNRDSTRYPTDWRNRGLAHVQFALDKDKEVYPRVPQITAEVKGNRVYDPRDSTWKFSNNPALVLLDYLTSARYGADIFYPERDSGDTDLSEIDEQSFIDAANYCDESVQDGSGGTQKRFTFDGWLDTGNALNDNINAILACMRGTLIHQAGKFRLVIRQTQSSVKTLTEDELVGNWRVRRAGAKKVPNRIVVKYAGGVSGDTTEDTQWPPVGDTTFLDQDAGHRNTMKATLVGVQDEIRAQQIGMVMLKEAREDAAVSVDAHASAMDLEIGDVITIDHATPGWEGSDAKDFWVVAMTLMSEERVKLTLKEYADSAYSLDSQTAPTAPPGSNLPDPTTTGAPSNLSLTSNNSTQMQTPSGDKVPAILSTWDKPLDKGIDRIVVLERENGTASWNTAAVVETEDEQRAHFHPKGATEGDTWEVGVYALVGQRLLKSSIVTGTVTLDTDYAAGDAVDAVTPEVRLRVDEETSTHVFVDLFVASGSDVSNPDLQYRTKIDGQRQDDDFGGWTAIADADDGTWINREISVRKPFDHPVMLIVQAQDQAPAPAPTDKAALPIDPIWENPDLPGSGRERRERAGQRGGEIPTLASTLHELRSRDGSRVLLDTVGETIEEVPVRDGAGQTIFDPTNRRVLDSAGTVRFDAENARAEGVDVRDGAGQVIFEPSTASVRDSAGNKRLDAESRNLEGVDVRDDAANPILEPGNERMLDAGGVVRVDVGNQNLEEMDVRDGSANPLLRADALGGDVAERTRIGGPRADPAQVVHQTAMHAAEGLAREQAQRSGIGGQAPGAEVLLGDVKSRDGSKTLVDTSVEEFTTDLRRPNGDRLDNVVQRLQSTGDLKQSVQHGSGFSVGRHHEEKKQQDGTTSVSFSSTYDGVPNTTVVPADGARVYSSGDSGSDQFHRLKTSGLDTQGFDELIGEIVITSNTTAIDDGFSSSQNAGSPENNPVTLDADGETAFSNLEDANSTPVDYTVTFDWDATNLSVGDDVTVHIEVNDGASSTNWTEVASFSLIPGDSANDQEVTFNEGLGADYDIRARVTADSGLASWSITMHGEDGSPPGVQYDRDDGSTVRSMSPGSGENVLWQAKDNS